MKVYLVYYSHGTIGCVEKVFLHRKDAEKYAKKCRSIVKCAHWRVIGYDVEVSE